MLKGIKGEVQPIVEKTFQDAMVKKYNSDFGVVMLPSVVTAMACDITKAPNMFHVKRSLDVDLEPLKITGAEMEKFIDEEGDVEMRRLREVCPGFAESEWIDVDEEEDG